MQLFPYLTFICSINIVYIIVVYQLMLLFQILFMSAISYRKLSNYTQHVQLMGVES